jgi:hypothetical protein
MQEKSLSSMQILLGRTPSWDGRFMTVTDRRAGHASNNQSRTGCAFKLRQMLLILLIVCFETIRRGVRLGQSQHVENRGEIHAGVRKNHY